SSIRFWRPSAATTEAPSRLLSRRGRIPVRVHRPELTAVLLCWQRNASSFWIILLLVSGRLEHAMIQGPMIGEKKRPSFGSNPGTPARQCGLCYRYARIAHPEAAIG